jgi:hypothetical protein
MLPPGWKLLAVASMPRPARRGFGWYSAHVHRASRPTKMIVIAASTAQPCRVSPTICPNV